MITYADMFAGAGGLSEGLTNSGLIGVSHIEADPHACMTLRTREAWRSLSEGDRESVYTDYLRGTISREKLYGSLTGKTLDVVSECLISRQSVPKLISQIEKNLTSVGANKLDVLVGGPPCQPFSVIGRHYNSQKSYDDRRWLFKHFMTVLCNLRPPVFLFENVPGLISMRDGKIYARILGEFKSAGYDCEAHVLNSAEYGVLQQRRRLIIIGWDQSQSVRPLQPSKISFNALVGEAFNDLPSLSPGEDASSLGYKTNAGDYLVKSSLRKTGDILTQHVARSHNDRDRKIYRLVAETWHKEKRRLLCGELPAELKPTRSVECFKDRFKVVAPDLAHCQTVIAHIAKDGHYYIHPDVFQARSITIREAARLQSFPDNYFFEGSRLHKFKQIGNAVPPLLGKAIGTSIRNAFETAEAAVLIKN